MRKIKLMILPIIFVFFSCLHNKTNYGEERVKLINATSIRGGSTYIYIIEVNDEEYLINYRGGIIKL